MSRSRYARAIKAAIETLDEAPWAALGLRGFQSITLGDYSAS